MTQFFLAQTIIIGVIIIGAWVATKVQIAKLEVKVSSLQSDHATLSYKLDGMSRKLAELKGHVKGVS
jgi:mannose/fructose/N-acetylgalactosamine-specific phosphotransferase system component IID